MEATICLNCQKTTASAAIIDIRISRKQTVKRLPMLNGFLRNRPPAE